MRSSVVPYDPEKGYGIDGDDDLFIYVHVMFSIFFIHPTVEDRLMHYLSYITSNYVVKYLLIHWYCDKKKEWRVHAGNLHFAPFRIFSTCNFQFHILLLHFAFVFPSDNAAKAVRKGLTLNLCTDKHNFAFYNNKTKQKEMLNQNLNGAKYYDGICCWFVYLFHIMYDTDRLVHWK